MTDQQFAAAVAAEVERARGLFPEANATNAALVEEVGEVSKALMSEPWYRVIAECIQVAAMAQRLAIEGDGTFQQFRDSAIHSDGTRFMNQEYRMPEVTDARS